jgi:hypothetical protein
LAQERIDDKLKTKGLINNIFLGHEGRKNSKKGRYAFDKLTAGRDDERRRPQEGEEPEGEVSVRDSVRVRVRV